MTHSPTLTPCILKQANVHFTPRPHLDNIAREEIVQSFVLATGVLSRLVCSSKILLEQFTSANGPTVLCATSLLALDMPPTASADFVKILSQMARSNVNCYPSIDAAQGAHLYDFIRALLHQSPDPNLRGKLCNLLGNMCRHSDYFYEVLKNHGLIEALIGQLSDRNVAPRKFACFGIGNAAFHSAQLYSELAPALPKLVLILADKDEKIQANAAGAIGNLLRNSGQVRRHNMRMPAWHKFELKQYYWVPNTCSLKRFRN